MIVSSDMDGDINTTLQLGINAAARIGLDNITLFEVPLSGIVVPG